MEVIVFLVVLVLFMIGFYLKSSLDFRARKRQFKNRLRTEYGKPRRNVEIPERYAYLGRYFAKHRKDYEVDDITWNDLNMDELYQRLNYAHSSCGEEYLYYRLRCPQTSREEDGQRSEEERMIAYLKEHVEERVELQMMFAQIGYTGKYSLYQYLDFLDNLGQRSNLRHYLAFVFYAVSALAAFFEPSVGIAMFVGVMIYQIATYIKERGEDEPYLVSFAFILRFLSGVEKLTQKPPEGLKEYIGGMRENLRDMRPVTRHAFFMAKENTQQGDPASALTDYLKMITHVNLISFNQILAAVRQKIKEIDVLYTQAGYLEYLLIVGEYQKSLPYYCIPQFEAQGGFACEELYHPLIGEPVACSFTAERGVLVTGSNASGKSTFLKSVALNAILAQSLGTVLAKSCVTAYYRVYTSMALRDDLDSGESYYMVEIRSLKRILDAAADKGQPGRVMCFVDEVLRGTNTVERIAASTQIMKHFAQLDVQCFAATHDIELSHLLEKEYDNYHFEEDVSDGDIHFNYELRSGRATTRNAIRLLEIMGYDAQIISRAESLAAKFVETGAWQ